VNRICDGRELRAEIAEVRSQIAEVKQPEVSKFIVSRFQWHGMFEGTLKL
jgi:hypothetical protein